MTIVIFKLQKIRISGKLLLLLKDVLKTMSGLKCPIFILERYKCRYCLESILGPLLSLIHINVLNNGLKSNPKLFADDNSLFSVIHDVNLSQIDLNED